MDLWVISKFIGEIYINANIEENNSKYNTQNKSIHIFFYLYIVHSLMTLNVLISKFTVTQNIS